MEIAVSETRSEHTKHDKIKIDYSIVIVTIYFAILSLIVGRGHCPPLASTQVFACD